MKKLLTILLAVSPSFAGTLPISWNAVTASDLAGYRVCWGTATGTYPNCQDVGLVTSVEITGLPDCTMVYVASKARDTAGNLSSNWSNEVSGWPRVVITPTAPRIFELGASYSINVAGANFRPGILAYMDYGTTRIQATGVSATSCTQAAMTITIPTTAPVNTYSLSIENADGTWGSLPSAANVVSNAPPPNVTGLSRTDRKNP